MENPMQNGYEDSNPLIDGFENYEPKMDEGAPNIAPEADECEENADTGMGTGEMDPPFAAEEGEEKIPAAAEEGEEKTPDTSSGADSFNDGSFAAYAPAKQAPIYNSSTEYLHIEGAPLYEIPFTPPPEDRSAKILKILGWVFFGLTIFTSFFSFIFSIVSIAMPEMNATATILVCLVFPAVSLAAGIVLKVKRAFYKPFFIIGIIGLAIISTLALLSLIDGETTGVNSGDENDLLIEKTEGIIGFELPDHTDVYYWTDFSSATSAMTELQFIGDDAEELNAEVEGNRNFKNSVPNPMIGMLPPECRAYESTYIDYVLIYNETTGAYNTMPSASGTYDFIAVIVTEDYGYSYVEIYEYTLYYKTTFDSNI